MAADPVGSFLRGMGGMQQIIRARNEDERRDQLVGMQMQSYERAAKREREADERAAKKRELAAGLVGLEAGNLSAPQVAELDPQAGVRLGDLSGAFDEGAQKQAVAQVWPLFDRVAKGEAVAENEREPIWAAGAALRKVGILGPDLAAVRSQAQVAPVLKNSIAQLSEQFAPQLLGKKTVIDEQNDPEMFAQFAQVFPAVANHSRVFKDGRGRPVQFYIDATGVERIQDARLFTVLEGVNPQTGQSYRAPLSVRRSNDPNDPLAGATLGELYAQADFAEKAAKTYLAALAGVDDAAAQKVFERYDKLVDQVWEQKRGIAQAQAMLNNPGIAGLVEKSPALQAALQGVASGTIAAGKFSELVVTQAATAHQEQRDEQSARVTLEAMAQAGQALGGRASRMLSDALEGLRSGKYASAKQALEANKELLKHAVDLDKEDRREAAATARERIKAGAAGSGAGAGGEGLPKGYVYDEFNKALLMAMVAKHGIDDGDFTADLMGNQRIDVNRYMHRLPEDARQQFLAAQSVGEGLMARGVSPIQAAQQALLIGTGEARQPGPQMQAAHGPGQGSPSAGYSRDEALVLARKELGRGARRQDVVDLLERFFPGAGAELDRPVGAGGEGRGAAGMAPQGEPREAAKGSGMAPAEKPLDLRGRMKQAAVVPKKDNAITRANEYPVELIGKGLKMLWQINPMRLGALGISDSLGAFQQWARKRYSHGDAERDPQALAEYAKVDPRGAQLIEQAAMELTR